MRICWFVVYVGTVAKPLPLKVYCRGKLKNFRQFPRCILEPGEIK